MSKIAQLGLVAACLFAACYTSRDTVLSPQATGGGGTAGGGAAGAGGAKATGGVGANGGAVATGGKVGTGGSGGIPTCESLTCFRPYQCVRSCGGPVESEGCCPCEAPLFDNFANLACGGKGGAGGKGGGASGGMSGTGGTAGTGGTIGTGGAGGKAGTGGTGGKAGTGGAGGSRPCEQFQCARPYECVRSCGGPIEYTGCCQCEAPLFDNFGGLGCPDGGQPTPGYSGCTFIGGLDRVVIARCDASMPFTLVLVNPASGTSTSQPGLTVPATWAFESAWAKTGATCPSRTLGFEPGTTVTGTVTWAALRPSSTNHPSRVNVDVTVSVPVDGGASPMVTTLHAQNVDVTPSCP